MRHLNFRQLYYFWVIAREGTMASAAERLDLTPQTLSGHLAALEEALNGPLFSRSKRRLTLTEFGQQVLHYADDMFDAAQDLEDFLDQPKDQRPLKVSLGITASIHKLIAYYLTRPALTMPREVRLSCTTGALSDLLAQLNLKQLDMVFADQQPPAALADRFRVQVLARSDISLFASPGLAARLEGDLPGSLAGQPFLATSVQAPYYTKLMNWFAQAGVTVKVAAEVDDSALIKVFGRAGVGLFAAPTVIREEVMRQYDVVEVLQIREVSETLYGITRARGLPGEVVAALMTPRENLFGNPVTTSEKPNK